MTAYLTASGTIFWLGIMGCLVIVVGSLGSGLAYTGKLGERYSILNHFISELGEVGVARRAWMFNLGLISGGLLISLECVGLGMRIPGILSKVGMAAGSSASLAVMLTGFFPMNRLAPHVRAAMTFFRLGLVTILLFSVAILLQPPESQGLPRLAGLVGIPAVVSYSSFLLYSARTFSTPTVALTPLSQARPRLWMLAFLEWLIFLTTISWFFAVAMLA